MVSMRVVGHGNPSTDSSRYPRIPTSAFSAICHLVRQDRQVHRRQAESKLLFPKLANEQSQWPWDKAAGEFKHISCRWIIHFMRTFLAFYKQESPLVASPVPIPISPSLATRSLLSKGLAITFPFLSHISLVVSTIIFATFLCE